MTRQLKPDYLIRLRRDNLSPAAPGSFTRLEIEAALNGGADSAVVSFGSDLDPMPDLDDPLRIELGWSGERSLVFTGAVVGIEPGLRGWQLRALNPLHRLMRTRASTAFENMTAGKIVTTLANQAGVEPGRIEEGGRTRYWYLNNQQPYQGCLTLARREGFDLYATEEGKLTFTRFARRKGDHVLPHGRDILRLSVSFGRQIAGATVVPESPASSSGDETAGWLVKDPSSHAATEGDENVLVVSDPMLRTREAAATAAKAIVAASRAAMLIANVSLVGRPEVRLGQAVELKGVPTEGVDGVYQVAAVRHVLDARRFRTTLQLTRISA